MFDAAEKFAFAGWFEYLANLTTLLVNVGLIWAAVWALRHRRELVELWRRLEALAREAIEAVRDYARALREASKPPPPPPPPADGEGPPVAQPPPVPPPPAQPPPARPVAAPTPSAAAPVKGPGCGGYIATGIALVVVALLARWMMSVLPIDPPPAETSAPVEERAAQLPPPTPATVPYSVTANSRCYALAQQCTGDGDRWVELGPLNGIDTSNPNFCLIREGETIQRPADWNCPD